MNNRIKSIEESPCYHCECHEQCEKKIERNPLFYEIKLMFMANRELDYHECGIWIALNAKEMVEVDE